MKFKIKRLNENELPYKDDMFKQYANTALWASVDGEGEPLDNNYTIDDIEYESRMKMEHDVLDFMDRAAVYLKTENYTPGDIGHLFWLSRNGHGSGFFDSEFDEADRLQDLAEEYGYAHLEVGDDGEIYQYEG